MTDDLRRQLATFRVLVEHLFPEAHGDPEIDPVRIAEAEAAKAPKRAGRMIQTTMNDLLPQIAQLDAATRARLAVQVEAAGGIPLAELLAGHGKAITSIVRRGRIRNEDEYYLVREVVELVEDPQEQDQLWAMLSAFEAA